MPATGRKKRVSAAVRRDGKCRECLGERPQLAVNERDPFCTAECCREYYGVVIPDGIGPGIRRRR